MAAPLPVICLAGPTGCGKTAAALTLAEALDGEVINADSRQVYSDFPLITAQPSPEEQACCPHHLYGFLPTEQKISAGRWADQAVAEAKAVLARSHVPLLVGGTGLYVQSFLYGVRFAEEKSPAGLREQLAAELAEKALPGAITIAIVITAVYVLFFFLSKKIPPCTLHSHFKSTDLKPFASYREIRS